MLHESRVRRAAERARLAARRNVRCDDYGTLVSGSIDPEFDLVHRYILELEDQILDGMPANPIQIKWFEAQEAALHALRPVLRQLELEIYAAA